MSYGWALQTRAIAHATGASPETIRTAEDRVPEASQTPTRAVRAQRAYFDCTGGVIFGSTEIVMKEAKADILSPLVLAEADAVGITTNGVVRKDRRAVMGAGVARRFRDTFEGIDMMLAYRIRGWGNRVSVIDHLGDYNTHIFSFPTKDHWRDPSKIELIEQSAEQLKTLTDISEWRNVWLPRPGCSNGGLSWSDVKPILEPFLDDRFTICYL